MLTTARKPWRGRRRALGWLAGGAALAPAVLRGPPPPFPLAGLRPWYLRAAYLGYRIGDDLF